jgi:Recombinase
MVERVRQSWSGAISTDYLSKQAEFGWRLVSIEWEREITAEGPAGFRESVPYGLQVASDGKHLEENPQETQVLLAVLEGIVGDRRLSQIAKDLNDRGLRTRNGDQWATGQIFELLPRIIEAGPRLLPSEEWVARREQLFANAF